MQENAIVYIVHKFDQMHIGRLFLRLSAVFFLLLTAFSFPVLVAQEEMFPIDIHIAGESVAKLKAPLKNHQISITLKSFEGESRNYTIFFESAEVLHLQFRDSYATRMQVADDRSETSTNLIFIPVMEQGLEAPVLDLSLPPTEKERNSVRILLLNPYGGKSYMDLTKEIAGQKDLSNVSDYASVDFVIGEGRYVTARTFHITILDDQSLSLSVTDVDNVAFVLETEEESGGALIRLVTP
ncbi:MAG: hypothetical protein EAZ89_07160 [Bacteroidetes bacterium]|nr:MAG: hypothetical protein EAZ89_07160 [Bacteroidota bacterium]